MMKFKYRDIFDEIYNSNNGSGIFEIGVCITEDFPVGVVLMCYQFLERTDMPFCNYFCQISDSLKSYESFSGAVSNKKITSGKFETSPKDLQ